MNERTEGMWKMSLLVPRTHVHKRQKLKRKKNYMMNRIEEKERPHGGFFFSEQFLWQSNVYKEREKPCYLSYCIAVCLNLMPIENVL